MTTFLKRVKKSSVEWGDAKAFFEGRMEKLLESNGKKMGG